MSLTQLYLQALQTARFMGHGRASHVSPLGLGIDNLLIELSAEEVPIMDGSAAPFIKMINSAGIVEQAPKQFLRITREIKVTQGDAFALLRPYQDLRQAIPL